VQGLVALYLTGAGVYGSWQGWRQYGPGAAKSPLYGIWNIEQPASGPAEGWRRLIFDAPGRAAIQKMDDTFLYRKVEIDVGQKSIDLTKSPCKFERPTPDRLTLDGVLDGQPLHLKMRLQDRSQFLLVSRGFHWVQDYPLNR
jgi:hypothetical protein